MTFLLATGKCFDDAVDYISMVVLHEPARAHGTDLILVHGIARIPDDNPEDAGVRFAHAWVEDRGVVLDAKLLDGERLYVVHVRDEYYARMRVEAATRYTVRQVWQQNRRTKTYGPWRPEYLALVKDPPPARPRRRRR